MPNELPIEHLSNDDIRLKAEQFLSRYHPAGNIPIPIEDIVDLQLKIDIVSLPGMRRSSDVDAFISRDMTAIYIDEHVYQSVETRFRFSLAHEIAHAILHQKVFSNLEYDDLQSWRRVYQQIPEEEYHWLEIQANAFAGFVLVPSDRLPRRFEALIDKASQKGFSFERASEGARRMLASRLADEFAVSTTVMEIRIKRENLWARFD